MANVNLYSIQSSKGGVGKTTIALNLAKSLQKNGSVSFIFDLDLCGTSISDMMIRKVSQERLFGDIKVTNLLYRKMVKDNTPEDLLGAFISYVSYNLEQNPLQQIEKKIEALKIPQVFSEVILLPSGTFSQTTLASQNESQHLLFNEIHAGWFCDFIFKIIERIENAKVFENVVNGREQFTINIIFDNAPGWSALRPLVETKIIEGHYDQYKFIFVSSPDEMDIRASVKRIYDLYIDYLRKFYTLAKFEILRFKCMDEGKLDQKYEYLEETDFYDEELFSEKVGTDGDNLSLPDLEKSIDRAQKHPENCFHLIINKSAHVESFQDQRIDLGKLSSTMNKMLDDYAKELPSLWKTNSSSKTGKDFNKIREVFHKIILIPFDEELFFHYQSNFISSPLDSLAVDNSDVPDFKPFSMEEDDKDYLVDFGQICVVDAEFYQSINDENTFVISNQERTVFLHSARISKAFYLLFEYLLKCLGDLPNFAKELPELVDAVVDGITYFLLSEKEMKPISFNERKIQLMAKVLEKAPHQELNSKEVAANYHQFLIEKHKNLLVDNSTQSALTILFTSSLYSRYKDSLGKISIYLKLLPEIFILIKEKGREIDNYSLAGLIGKKLTDAGINHTRLELQYVVDSLDDAILSMGNLKNKHNYFLRFKSRFTDGKLSDARVQYIKQLLKILYFRPDFNQIDIKSMISARLKSPLENNISLTTILVRTKLKKLKLLP
jgi:hypothetical protein